MLLKSFSNLFRLPRPNLLLASQRRFYFDQNHNKPQKEKKESKEVVKEEREDKGNDDDEDILDFPYIWMNTDELTEIPKTNDEAMCV